MLKFDNTINSILNRLIFEQDGETTEQEGETIEQTETDKTEVPESTEETKTTENQEEKALADIENKYQKEGNSFLAQSESQYNSGEEYINKFIEDAQKLISFFSNNKEEVNESALKDDLVRIKDYAVSKSKDFLNYISPAQEKLADMTVNNIDKISEYSLGKKFAKELNDNLSESFLYKAAAIFLDPTGIMSWPYLKKATDEFEKHKDTEDEAIYQLNLLAAQISVIPNFAFKPIFGILTLPFRLLFGGGAKIAEKVFGVTGTRKVARGLANWIKGKLPFKPRTAKLTDQVISKKGLLPKIIKPVKAGLEVIKKNPVKAAVVASGGDIPKTTENIKKTLENWREQGSKIQSTPRVSNLGKFRDWSSLSTQSF